MRYSHALEARGIPNAVKSKVDGFARVHRLRPPTASAAVGFCRAGRSATIIIMMRGLS
jgi:hypothetical protein